MAVFLNMDELELLPDIEDYLEQLDDNAPIDTKNLDELIFRIRSHTGLEVDTIKIIVRFLFQETRNQILRGNIISINSLGKLFISNPKVDTKKKIFINFKPFKKMIRKLNGKY